MYLFLEEGHLDPECMSNKSPGILLQAGLDAAPDLILGILYFEMSLTKGSVNFLNSFLRVDTDTPPLA